MKIIICGGGKVGLSIARYLARYNNDITIIDYSPQIVREVSERYDVQAIEGFVSDPEVLSKAGAQDAEMLIAVTHLDEVNMIACEVANALFKIPTKIARIRNQAYLKPKWIHLFDESNISVDVTISPEVEVAKSISRSLSVPGANSITLMANGAVSIIGVKCTSGTPIVNTPITHITSIAPEIDIRVIAISRNSNHLIPLENDKILSEDTVYFAVAQENIPSAMKAFGHHEQRGRRVVVLGGGNIGFYLAQAIETELPEVTSRIVEFSQERAEFISNRLEDTVVINGNALDSEILAEAGIEATETVIAVTEDDKVNTLASLLAKRCGAKRAMALINNPDYNPLLTSLGIDSIINPREITVSSILRHIRKGHIRSVHTLREGLGEIIEAEVHENSRLVGAKLIDVEIPAEILIAAVVRKDEVIIPNESTVIQLDDRVIVMAQSKVIKEVEQLFTARMEYF